MQVIWPSTRTHNILQSFLLLSSLGFSTPLSHQAAGADQTQHSPQPLTLSALQSPAEVPEESAGCCCRNWSTERGKDQTIYFLFFLENFKPHPVSLQVHVDRTKRCPWTLPVKPNFLYKLPVCTGATPTTIPHLVLLPPFEFSLLTE